jgi:2-succinyl-5-enolpyruvyl-6-hydroxy-3-cyclohexene-1-carboxylate synthase
VIPSTDVVPQLRLIVSSNNGGGVFSTIEQNGVAGFEQVFGTPHDLVIAEVLQALGIKTTVIKNKSELELVLQTPALISAAVIEGLDRAVEAKLRAELVAAAKSMR